MNTSEEIVMIILSDILSKLPKDKKTNAQERKLTANNLSRWIDSKNSPAIKSEVLVIFENLTQGGTIETTVYRFAEAYASQIVDSHQNFLLLSSKAKKTKKLCLRTRKFVQELSNSFPSSILNPPNTKRDWKPLEFSLIIQKVEGDLTPSLPDQENDFIGYHVEVGYKEKKIFTSTKKASEGIIDFDCIRIKIELSEKVGTAFLLLYEDYVSDTGISKRCVGKRNIDFFSSISPEFIENIIAKKPFSSEWNKINNYQDFFLKKNTSDIISFNTSDNYFKISLFLSCENIENTKDLSLYLNLCQYRLEYLKERESQIHEKIKLYKTKLHFLIAPIQDICGFDEREIKIKNDIKEKHKKSCDIF